MIARSRNFEMLLFKPVALNKSLLRELGPTRDETDVDLRLVKDPLLKLKRGSLVEHAQLALLMRNPIEPQIVSGNGNAFDVPVVSAFPQSGGSATETWEDEGGKYSKGA
jgi:hypothetical protein